MGGRDRRRAEFPVALSAAECEFHLELRRLVELAGLTLRELEEMTSSAKSSSGQACFYSKSQWGRWLNGQSRPPRKAVKSLAGFLAEEDISAEHLLELWDRTLLPSPELGPANGASLTIRTPEPVQRTVAGPQELPADVDSFTGRVAELAELDRLLAAIAKPAEAGELPRAVVISALSGTAGVGKTALALRWAHKVQSKFPDGQLYVNLRGYDPDPPLAAGDALARFLRTLGKRDRDIPLELEERAACFRSAVHGKRMLMVLDNAATAEQVRPLLPGAGSVVVVVTSRDSLAGLVARDGARRIDLDLLPAEDAVALLRRLIGGRVDADPMAAQALAGQCARLPLALRVAAELAVGRPAAPLRTLADELADQARRLDLLDAGGDPRSAVRAVFSWSYSHLPAPAARAFRMLGLHPGPDLDRYAAAALAGVTVERASQLLDVLARGYLIQPSRVGRYGMHDLLRAYAAQLVSEQDGDGIRTAALTSLFDYYLAAAAAAMNILSPAEQHRRPQPPLSGTPFPDMPDAAVSRAWLGAELPVLVAVAAHAARHGWPGHATGLAATLRRYLEGGCNTDAIAVYTHALHAACRTGDPATQADVLTSLGGVHKRQGRQQQAAGCHHQALTLFREIGDRGGEARALGNLGNVHERQGRYQAALDFYQQARTLFYELGDRLGEARTLGNLGLIHERQGAYPEAGEHHQQALALFCQFGDQLGEARTRGNLGDVCQRQGRYREAGEHHQHALALFRGIGDRGGEADTLNDLGVVCQRQGRYREAGGHHQQALALFREVGDRFGEARTLVGLGVVCQRQGRHREAAEYHQQALMLSREFGDRYGEASALAGLGVVCQGQGEYLRAADCHQDALTLFREIGDCSGEAEVLNDSGETLLATAQPDQARACHGTALTLARKIGDQRQQARAYDGLARAGYATGHVDLARHNERRALDIYASLGVLASSTPPPG